MALLNLPASYFDMTTSRKAPDMKKAARDSDPHPKDEGPSRSPGGDGQRAASTWEGGAGKRPDLYSASISSAVRKKPDVSKSRKSPRHKLLSPSSWNAIGTGDTRAEDLARSDSAGLEKPGECHSTVDPTANFEHFSQPDGNDGMIIGTESEHKAPSTSPVRKPSSDTSGAVAESAAKKPRLRNRRGPDGESHHHRSLRLWEADLALGDKAKHGPVLYALDKLQDQLQSDCM